MLVWSWKLIYAAMWFTLLVVGDVGRTVEQRAMGPLSCSQSYREFITAHWARQKCGIQSIRGFRFLWDQRAVGCTLSCLFTCCFIVSSCVCLSLTHPLCLLHSPKQHAYIKTVCKKHKNNIPRRHAPDGISLVIISLLRNTLKTSNFLFYVLLTCFQNVPGVFFSEHTVTKKKNKLCNG